MEAATLQEMIFSEEAKVSALGGYMRTLGSRLLKSVSMTTKPHPRFRKEVFRLKNRFSAMEAISQGRARKRSQIYRYKSTVRKHCSRKIRRSSLMGETFRKLKAEGLPLVLSYDANSCCNFKKIYYK